jgi:apolipoprotein D and lipocalin family protein
MNAAILTAAHVFPAQQETVDYVDLSMYTGKWYVIGSIPTIFDRNWDYTNETYRMNRHGYMDICTSYMSKKGKIKKVQSKGFIDRSSRNAKWKVQYVWPFKADYWIIELCDDYSYVVIGHPKHKFLFIMSRTPVMRDDKYESIAARCGNKGYDISKLRKQKQPKFSL